jgi:hypothetical protein
LRIIDCGLSIDGMPIADCRFDNLASAMRQSAIGNRQSAIGNRQSAIGNRQSAIPIDNPQSTIRNQTVSTTLPMF